MGLTLIYAIDRVDRLKDLLINFNDYPWSYKIGEFSKLDRNT